MMNTVDAFIHDTKSKPDNEAKLTKNDHFEEPMSIDRYTVYTPRLMGVQPRLTNPFYTSEKERSVTDLLYIQGSRLTKSLSVQQTVCSVQVEPLPVPMTVIGSQLSPMRPPISGRTIPSSALRMVSVVGVDW